MIKLVDLLKEIKVNNPGKILVGYIKDGESYLDPNILKQNLLPLFPGEEESIEEYGIDLSTMGDFDNMKGFNVIKDKIYTTLKDLIEVYKYHKENF